MKLKNQDFYDAFKEKANLLIEARYNLPTGNMPYVKPLKISEVPLSFENKCAIYFDMNSLPVSCSYVEDLSNKQVAYGIFCNGKIYIGSTSNFGERMRTHAKDRQNGKKHKGQKLYADIVKSKRQECFSFVICISDDKEQIKEIEHTLIGLCKDMSLEKSCNYDEKIIKFIKESSDDTKKESLNYCYNIID